MEKQDKIKRVAKHEAAHFVIAWATECPAYHVDITPAAHKVCSNDPNHEIVGRTFGICGRPTPLEHILIDLAGPVADYWEQGNVRLREGEKVDIEHALSSIADSEWLDQDDGDWDSCLRWMANYGIDVLDHKSLNDALSLFLDAVRATLKLCEKEWKEAAEYLAAHGRIGFDGEHPDSGEEAESFFFRWGEDWGVPPQNVRNEIDGLRAKVH